MTKYWPNESDRAIQYNDDGSIEFLGPVKFSRVAEFDNSVSGSIPKGFTRDVDEFRERWDGQQWRPETIDINSLATGILTVDNDDRPNMLTRESATELRILGGTGLVIDHTNPLNPEQKFVRWLEQVIPVGTGDGAHIVGIDKFGVGSVSPNVSPIPTPAERREFIRVGGVLIGSPPGDITAVPFGVPIYDLVNRFLDLTLGMGVVNNIDDPIDAGPSAVGTGLQLKVTAGTVFSVGVAYAESAVFPDLIIRTTDLDPAVVIALTLSDETFSISATGEIDPDQYESSPGVLSSVGNNNFTLQRLFVAPSVRLFIIYYGTVQFNKLGDGIIGDITQQFEEKGLSARSVLVRSLVVKEGTTDLTDASDAFFATGWRMRAKL